MKNWSRATFDNAYNREMHSGNNCNTTRPN